MENAINQRIKKVIEYSGKSINAYATTIGISQPTLKSCVDGVNKPSYETIQKILIGSPMISAEWLLRGEGEMIIPDGKAQIVNGNNNMAVNGDNVGDSNALEKALNSLLEQQKITVKAQEQIDSLLQLLNKLK